MGFSHFNEDGKAMMVDVTDKDDTQRRAVAKGKITVSKAVFDAIAQGTAAKGDVLGVATTAGIMAAKKSWEMIPMCHAIPIGSCSIDFETLEETLEIYCTCTVKTYAKTGVEMEALTGVGVALLTIYDMCKAIDKNMEIDQIHLVEKSGGKSGHIVNERYRDGKLV